MQEDRVLDDDLCHGVGCGLYREQISPAAWVETFTYRLAEVDRAVLDGEDLARVHVKAGTDRIVGATSLPIMPAI